MRGGKGTHRISHSSAITSSSSLLSHKKGWAGRCCGLGRKGISSLSPHTMAHVDAFPGSQVLCLDQVHSCVGITQCSAPRYQTWIKPQKPANPQPLQPGCASPAGYQTFIKPGSNPKPTNPQSLFSLALLHQLNIKPLSNPKTHKPTNPQPLQPGSASPAPFVPPEAKGSNSLTI